MHPTDKKLTSTQMQDAEIVNERTGEKWVYSEIVKDHFFHPRNLLLEDPQEGQFDAVGIVGSPACGDVMKIWIKVDPTTDRIADLKWQTFGCGSAIASTSMFSVMCTEDGGIQLTNALQIKPQHVMERLAGLPNRKIHCSVLADKAFRKAANEYFRASGQHQRVIVEHARVVDDRLNITDKDIEEAVLEGAQTLEDVQRKLKVGVGNPDAIPEIEQLIRFYHEKYYG
ncbi:MAG: iron-sulfur cluster assembly scaffold protein [bacterium]|nr:iron-sulfur cluster assembly scaffold protein [bacterium]